MEVVTNFSYVYVRKYEDDDNNYLNLSEVGIRCIPTMSDIHLLHSDIFQHNKGIFFTVLYEILLPIVTLW